MGEIDVLWWTAWILGILVAVGAVMPFVRSGAWPVRVWDFPRMHLMVASAAVVLLGLGLGWRDGWRWDAFVLSGVAATAAVVQGRVVLAYTRAWPRRVRSTEEDCGLLAMNLQYDNDRHEEVADVIARADADLVLLIEIDEAWRAGCRRVRETYPHRIEEVRDEGLGIALWSRRPLRGGRIEHLVSERRGSIWTTIRLGDRDVRFIGLHPTPPGLTVRHGRGRYDSRIRDAELVEVAMTIDRATREADAEERDVSWIVAGDFNDVAWSHTTRLFERTSGLLDPRIGRGMYATYHAGRPFMRFPLDHLFLSSDLGVARLERIRTPGSDHMALLVGIGRVDGHRQPPSADTPDEEDQAETGAMVDEGHGDASERDEEADRG